MTIQNIITEGLLPIGTLLGSGRYRIVQHLASGGFGKTYLALNNFDERVAIKELYIKGVCGRIGDGNEVSVTLSENVNKFAQQQEKFRKEAKRLRSLVHPNIVRVHDLFDENGTSYYVMDYVDGESIGTMMKRTQQPMPEEQVLGILGQLLDALECVHAEKIWHLDLKPANIMLDKKGNALLIDFGTSKQFEDKNGEQVDTSTTLAYTQGYAPSEQMEQNFEKFGPWTDIYALGATIYRMLTYNNLPSPTDIDENPTEALPFPDTVSKKTRDLIFWMMKPLRTRRPQSIAEIRAFLATPPAAPATEERSTANNLAKELSNEDTAIISKPSNASAEVIAVEVEKPAVPVAPPAPEKPAAPAKPVAPEKPAAPAKPVAPAKPAAPVTPPAPEKPAAPAKPAVPAKPAAPEKPAKPVTPEPFTPATPNSGNAKKWLLGIGIAAAIGIVGGVIFSVSTKPGVDAVDPEIAADTLSHVTNHKIDLVANYTGTEKNPAETVFHTLGQYTYTGEVTADTIPNGRGTAVFADGSKYEGTFKNGFCEGDNVKFTLPDGDRFEGKMTASEYTHGRYTANDGSYFEGDYKNSYPNNGTWYKKDGTVDAQVVNGKEFKSQ